MVIVNADLRKLIDHLRTIDLTGCNDKITAMVIEDAIAIVDDDWMCPETDTVQDFADNVFEQIVSGIPWNEMIKTNMDPNGHTGPTHVAFETMKIAHAIHFVTGCYPK